MNSRERNHKILEATILTYAEFGVPVGSEFLLGRYPLGVSSATIRNVMAELEEQGLLTHPHTSAGRVPTDQGYRYYVDLLMERDRVGGEDEERIGRLQESREREPADLLEEASAILSEMTQKAGVALVPQLLHGSFRRMELIPLGPREMVAVLVSGEGMVRHAVWELEEAAGAEELEALVGFLQRELEGMQLAQAAESLRAGIHEAAEPELERWKDSTDVGRLVRTLFQEEPSVVLEGTSWILEAPEFRDVARTRRLLKGLESKSELISILQRDLWADDVKLHIGSENRGTSLVDCSIVAAPYRLRGGMVGTIGVLGPTRMDYPRVTGLVQRMGQCLTRLLQDR